jgi:MFS family permease
MSSYKANIKVMYAFKFLLSMHFIGGVLVPFFLDWGQITFTQIMILQSIFVFSIFLLEIPTGAVADYFGRKTSLIFAAITIAIGAIVYTITPNFYMFILAEFIWAIGFALLSGADQALVYDSLKKIKSEKQSKKIFGRFNSFELTALMISAPIGSLIAATIGLRFTMMFMAIPFSIAFFVAFSLKEPKTKKKIESKRYFNTLLSGVKYFRGHKVLKILAFDMITISALVFFIIWTYQPLLKQLGVPLIYFGFIHAAITGIQIPFMNKFEKLEKIFKSKKNYLLWSAIIAGIAFIFLGINTYVPVTIMLLIIISAFGLSRYVLFQSYMNKYIESHNRSTVLSSISMVNRFVRGLLYPLAGLLVEWSLNYAIIIIGVLIVIFALLSKVKEEHLID